MPSVRIVKMNMIIGNARPDLSTAPIAKTTPIAKSMSKLYAPMVMRIAGAKSGCACGK